MSDTHQISDFYFSEMIHKNVARFDISMDGLVCMHVLEA